jgi:hypothetical protein
MAARQIISSCFDKHRMQRGCWVQPASVISVLSMVALLVLQQCPPTSSAAAATAAVVDDTARNSRVTVTAPPADYTSSSAIMLRPLNMTQTFSVLDETYRRHRMLQQQPTNVSGGSINTAALDTQNDDRVRQCVDDNKSDSHAQCRKTRECIGWCARSPADPRANTCVCCRPGYITKGT